MLLDFNFCYVNFSKYFYEVNSKNQGKIDQFTKILINHINARNEFHQTKQRKMDEI